MDLWCASQLQMMIRITKKKMSEWNLFRRMRNDVPIVKPIKNDDAYLELCALVERMKRSTWKRSDVNFEGDARSLSKLNNLEQNILLMTSGFFLTIDSVVMDSLNTSLMKDLELLSRKNKQLRKTLEFYVEQNRQEEVHDEFYKDMGKALFPDSYDTVRKRCHENFPEFKRVFDFCQRFQQRTRPLGERLFAYALIECIVFFPFFAAIIRHRFSGNISSTVSGNHWVCNEEAMHVLGHSCIFKLVGGVSDSRAKKICDELVFLVKDMWTSRILRYGENDVNGFTLVMVCEYVDDLSEFMLGLTGFKESCAMKSPFCYMNYLQSYTRANFFETRVIEYDALHDVNYHDGFFNDSKELKACKEYLY